MENTGKIFFKDDVPQWYVAMGDRWLGPLSASDVYQRVVDQHITWAHYVWKAGQSEWKRICDTKTFQSAVPHLPTKSITHEVKQAAAPEIRQTTRKYPVPPPVPGAVKESDEKIWFLYYNQSSFGPFAKSEVENAVRAGKINGKIFVWKDGMDEWKRLEAVASFHIPVAGATKRPPGLKAVAGEEPAAAKKSESRKAPRRPLVAKIVMAHDDAVSVGVCRDISIGGMQVLMDRIPSTVGKRIKLNVSAKGQIESFVAEGTVVRILEDGRGFSFRFEKLSEAARKSIETYISLSGSVC